MAEYLKTGWPQRVERQQEVIDTVSRILSEVEREGLPAIRRWSVQLDGWDPQSFVVPADEIKAAVVDEELAEQLEFARSQVEGFARAQRATMTDLEIETMPGVVLGHRHVPIAKVGSYSPGGRYPLIASSIMTVTVPKVAGVDTVVAVAPPRDGRGIYGPQLFTMNLAGADVIVCLGGVQAFAALAFGVEEVEPVDLVVGAGNAYVAEAKRQLFGRVGIDLLAGPTEVAVIADESADPRLVAADLLGQAEHGFNSPALLITTSQDFGTAVIAEVERWLAGDWPTVEVAGGAWREHGTVVVCSSREEVVEISDSYAPEHLEIQTSQDDWYAEHLRNYGSLFIGPEATVAFSDKSIGTNHVLPTGRAGRYTGGLWVGKFLKTVTYQRLTTDGARTIAPSTAAIADAELMFGHALTARLRME
ncbi:histidinol dehydrogenase [Kribbella monticola]|uniref:histidinol dehydrogenase n=1 Tax=Kribbella monticola TaxID=2185285 RepID=UPI000DD4A927|nr:histidinol dehydrogenase [Kribbella monticola]